MTARWSPGGGRTPSAAGWPDTALRSLLNGTGLVVLYAAPDVGSQPQQQQDQHHKTPAQQSNQEQSYNRNSAFQVIGLGHLTW